MLEHVNSSISWYQESGVAKDRKGKRKRKKSKKLLQAEGDEEEKEMVKRS